MVEWESEWDYLCLKTIKQMAALLGIFTYFSCEKSNDRYYLEYGVPHADAANAPQLYNPSDTPSKSYNPALQVAWTSAKDGAMASEGYTTYDRDKWVF